METLDPPSLQKIKIAKMARFYPSRGFILDLVGWGQGAGEGEMGVQPRSQGSLLPALRVGENPGNEVDGGLLFHLILPKIVA